MYFVIVAIVLLLLELVIIAVIGVVVVVVLLLLVVVAVLMVLSCVYHSRSNTSGRKNLPWWSKSQAVSQTGRPSGSISPWSNIRHHRGSGVDLFIKTVCAARDTQRSLSGLARPSVFMAVYIKSYPIIALRRVVWTHQPFQWAES